MVLRGAHPDFSTFCKSFRRLKKRNWTVNRPKLHSPRTEVNDYVNNHVAPKNTHRIPWCIHKDSRRAECAERTPPKSVISALWHKEQPHVTYTTVCKQTLNICLSQGCNSSYNHRKCSKQSQSTTKRHAPNCMPMMSPKSKNCNFRLYCNPQGYTRPSTHVDIRNPKVQRSCCLFPEQSSRDKPNTKSSKQRRRCSCSLDNLFNMRQRCLSSLPIDKTNSQKGLTTSKSTQQEIFHCCL
jgi:hypothetical protein